MNRHDKILYHQIHPLKLLTDSTTGLAALYLLWQRRLGAALVIATAPAALVSAILIRYADLDPYKRSSLGRYAGRYMTAPMFAVRFAGYGIMMIGAWYRRTWLLTLGLSIIVLGWLRGKLFPRFSDRSLQ